MDVQVRLVPSTETAFDTIVLVVVMFVVGVVVVRALSGIPPICLI